MDEIFFDTPNLHPIRWCGLWGCRTVLLDKVICRFNTIRESFILISLNNFLRCPSVMPEKLREREQAMYEPVRQILLAKFKGLDGEAYLENTSNGVFSEKLKEALEFMALHVLRVERFSPDLTGYHQKTEYSIDRIVVEIKARRIRIRDIYQAKMYADILDATYCILVSSESLTREIREFINKRNLLHRLTKNIIISKYQKDDNKIIIEPIVLKEIYYGTEPEPFKLATFKAI